MKHKQDEILIQSLPGSLDNVNFIVNHDKNNMKHFHEISGLIKEMIYERATTKAVEIPNNAAPVIPPANITFLTAFPRVANLRSFFNFTTVSL